MHSGRLLPYSQTAWAKGVIFTLGNVGTAVNDYSIFIKLAPGGHLIFFVTYERAMLARVLHNARLEKLA
jgi:hypothetical protein